MAAGLAQQKSDGRSDHAGPDNGEGERRFFPLHFHVPKKRAFRSVRKTRI
jgi:hypothetical protein